MGEWKRTRYGQQGEDSWRGRSREECVKLNLSIKRRRDEGQRVPQRVAGRRGEQHCDRSISKRSVRRLLRRISYSRRRGRMTTPPRTETRKAPYPPSCDRDERCVISGKRRSRDHCVHGRRLRSSAALVCFRVLLPWKGRGGCRARRVRWSQIRPRDKTMNKWQSFTWNIANTYGIPLLLRALYSLGLSRRRKHKMMRIDPALREF